MGPPGCVCHTALLKFSLRPLYPQEDPPPGRAEGLCSRSVSRGGSRQAVAPSPAATAASQVARSWRGLTWGRMMVFELSAHTTSTLLLTSTRATWPTDGCRTNDSVECSPPGGAMAKAPQKGRSSSGWPGRGRDSNRDWAPARGHGEILQGGPAHTATTGPVHRAPARPPGSRAHGPLPPSLSQHARLSGLPGVPRTGCQPRDFCFYFSSAGICLTPTKVPLFSKAQL